MLDHEIYCEDVQKTTDKLASKKITWCTSHKMFIRKDMYLVVCRHWVKKIVSALQEKGVTLAAEYLS